MPVAELAADGQRIIINTEFRERERIKQLPGAKWSTHEQTWWAPLSWAACIQLRSIFGQELQVGSSLGAWARNERAVRVDPCMALRTAADAEDVGDERLRPFQRAGAKFLATAKRALIADQMGTGKTLQVITALELIGDDAFPALVVCPNSMKYTWQAEYEKWASHRRTVVITGGKATRQKQIASLRDGEFDVAIINWEGLRGHTRLEGYGSLNLSESEKELKELNEVDLKTVIADECHKAKDPRSKQTRALWWVAKNADNRFALTGTPIANSPEDIWAIMHFIEPNEWPAKTKMIERYALQSWNMFGFMEIAGLKSETKDELFQILDPRFIRRTKEAVLTQLPQKTYTTRTVEMQPKQKKAYEQLRKEMIAELDNGMLVVTNPLVKMTRLLQLASAYAEIDETGKPILAEPSCKIDALEEIIEELGDQRAVVFAESRQLIELAYRRLVRVRPHGLGLSVGVITGQVDIHARKEAEREFNSGRHKVMLMTLGAGAEGLSFPGCSTEIFLQRSFSAVKNQQAEDRCHGIGRGIEGVATNIIDIITVDTAEPHVHEVLARKAENLEEIARDEETLRTWLMR